jgi:hypothetical protein
MYTHHIPLESERPHFEIHYVLYKSFLFVASENCVMKSVVSSERLFLLGKEAMNTEVTLQACRSAHYVTQ